MAGGVTMFPYAAWLCWVIPVIGAILTPIIAKFDEKARDYFAVAVSLLAAIMAALLIPYGLSGRFHIPGVGEVALPADWRVHWIKIFGVEIDAGVLVDPLSIFMVNVVAWISFLIMVYSLGYMHGEESLTRYWFFMNFFIGNMLLLVMSDNILQMLFGWEGVGLCSYQLIGFWYHDERKRWVGDVPPSHAGMKAFIMTRAGDVALMISAFIIFTQAGTFNFLELQHHYDWVVELAKLGLIVPVAVIFFGGPIGKSAQFPLHEWLPEAMAGPTSVSALIHAATMVKAGVYLTARVFPIFTESFKLAAHSVVDAATRQLIAAAQNQFFSVVAWIGAFTAFLAASQAMVARELKKVLAYSTVSQIGYMMLALGVGGLAGKYAADGYVAGLFHLMSHAIFKALLFMSAGAVLHACETTDMFEMGGIRKEMPITFACMLIGALSLSGIPPLSGFWSKEAIFGACMKTGNYALLAVAAITAAMTFFYSIRMIGVTFLGEKSHHLKELEEEGHHIHEAPPVMWVSYGILAAATVGIGLIGPIFEHNLHEFLASTLHAHHSHTALFSAVSVAGGGGGMQSQLMTTAITALMLIIGGVPGYMMYISRKIDPEEFVEKHGLKPIYNFLWNRWYINPTYYKVLVYSLIDFSRSLYKNFEVKVVDGANYAFARVVAAFSNAFRRIQTGILSYNMIGMAIGLLLVAWLLIWLGV
ncbi:MAG: NADH-quinone oxidoreductase subunit L [Candidatus Methanomethylicota archaeon]|uniref:NADH-quinone oxidoreductase subunit L n=1 Tax=Thermoproteota archaeon TaxID=2056631 RepID=A0A497EX33_9CREN|nr:MAG: NADH-quinone oxidoreductase subunit L [Candidatus Verstraetearchaeota archaeon]